MLSHRYRFHGHGSLRYLYKNGQTSRTRNFLLRYVPNKTRVHSRFAVIVGKKVFKAAAKRNRIRRRIYEVLRVHSGELSEGYDFSVTVFSPEVLTMSHESLEREVLDLFKHVRPIEQSASDK